MLIGDFWCGTKSATQAFEDQGDEVVSIDICKDFNPTICRDIQEVGADELIEEYGQFDFIWNSPDCSCFSPMAFQVGHFKLPDPTPRTPKAIEMIEAIDHTLQLNIDLAPKIGFVFENPRGILRKLPALRSLPRVEITYCSYGDSRMKPTDLWGHFPRSWAARPPCRNENPNCDHERAPAGSTGGTVGLEWAERIRVPRELSESFARACRTFDDPSTWKTLERWSL